MMLIAGPPWSDPGQGPHGPTVEAAKEADEPGSTRHVARKLDRRLHRLGAGLAEEAHRRLVHGRESRQAFAQRDHPLVPVVARDVEEVSGGLSHRGNHQRVRVTGGTDRDAGSEIEKAVAVHVPDLGPAAM